MNRQLLFVIAATLPIGHAMASNLLQDSGFAAGIDPPWAVSNSPSGVSWNTMDEADALDSGSLLFTDVGEFGALVSQCVDVSVAPISHVGFSYLIPDDVSPVSFAPGIFLLYYAQPLCAGSSLDSDDFLPPSPYVQGNWTRVEVPINLAPGTLSVSYGLYFSASGSSNNRAFVDNALLGDPPLFSDRFEAATP